MASDLEFHSTQVLSQESDLLLQAFSSGPEHYFAALELPSAGYTGPQLRVKEQVRAETRHRDLTMKQRLFHSFDLTFGVDVMRKTQTRAGPRPVPGSKTPALAMILRGKSEASIKIKKASESNAWHHPKVPRVLINYLLDKQLKKLEGSREDCDFRAFRNVQRPTRCFKRPQDRRKVLPPLAKCERSFMRRMESSLF